MKYWIALVSGLALAAGSATAQSRLPQLPGAAANLNLVSSHSGQFHIAARPSTTLASRFPGIATNLNFTALEPALLAVSCERIKDILYRELNAPAQWRGKVFLNLREAVSADETITIITEKSRGEWSYRVELPDVLERNRLVEAVVQVLLLEMANRHSPARSAEIPAWVASGFSQQLLALGEMEIILPPPRFFENGLTVTRVNINSRKQNRLAQAQRVLNSRPPLTFEELSWPTEEQLTGPDTAVYRSSAQLLVAQLLRLKNGPECFRAMLAELPQRLNWQLAFADAFRTHFPQPLDVEKWWALQVTQFTRRDLTRLWTYEESWNRLEEVLRPAVQVRVIGSPDPLNTTVSLQNVITEWDRLRQSKLLKRKLWELDLLRIHVAQELIPLVDEYRQTLQVYLQKRNWTGSVLPAKAPDIVDGVAQETVRALNALDNQRATLQPVRQPVAAAVEKSELLR